jgi:hypothetical protein
MSKILLNRHKKKETPTPMGRQMPTPNKNKGKYVLGNKVTKTPPQGQICGI